MTAVAAAFGDGFKALAVDSTVLRGDRPVTCEKVRRLSAELFATVVGSEVVLDAISQLYDWADYKKVNFKLERDEEFEMLSSACYRMDLIFQIKGWNVPKQDTSVILISREFIKIIDFKMLPDCRIKFEKQRFLKKEEIYVNYGGTETFMPMKFWDIGEAQLQLEKIILAEDVVAKANGRPLPYEMGNRFSFVAFPDDNRQVVIEAGPYITFSEYLCLIHSVDKEACLLKYSRFDWSPF